jgi:hypothetical protein
VLLFVDLYQWGFLVYICFEINEMLFLFDHCYYIFFICSVEESYVVAHHILSILSHVIMMMYTIVFMVIRLQSATRRHVTTCCKEVVAL